MHLAKLNMPPLKVLEKYKSPGGLIEDLEYMTYLTWAIAVEIITISITYSNGCPSWLFPLRVILIMEDTAFAEMTVSEPTQKNNVEH